MNKKKIAELAVFLCLVIILVYVFNNKITPAPPSNTDISQTEANTESEVVPTRDGSSSEVETDRNVDNSDQLFESIPSTSYDPSQYEKNGNVIVVKADAEGNLTQVTVPEWNYMADDYYKRTVTRKYDVPISEERVKKWQELYKKSIFALDPNDFFDMEEIMIIEDETFDNEDFQYHYTFRVENMTLVDTVDTFSGAFITTVQNPFIDQETLKAGYYTVEGDTDKVEHPYCFLDVEFSITNRKSKVQRCQFRYPTLGYWKEYDGEKVMTETDSIFLDGSDIKTTFLERPIYVSSPEVLNNSFYWLEPGEEKTYHVLFFVDPEKLEQCVLVIIPSGGGIYRYSEDIFLISIKDALEKQNQ